MKHGSLAALGIVSIGLLSLVACPGSRELCDNGACDSPADGGGSSSGGDAAADVSTIDAPPGCDLTKDPKESPACIDDAVGVFVSPTGSDSAAGTKAQPFRTLTKALATAGPKRVYACNGAYPEKLSAVGVSQVSLFGGLECGSYRPASGRVVVAPTERGVVLKIRGVATVRISDVDVAAADAVDPGESSIAAFIDDVSSATIVRSKITAGVGQPGKDAAPPATNLFSSNVDDLQGNSASGAQPGDPKTCACKVHGTSTGGKGGIGGGGNGIAGSASPTALTNRDGAGGSGSIPSCNSGSSGGDGAARAGGKGAVGLGSIADDGWKPEAGTNGEAGNPGQGGGGGGARANGGGGGGCGGCGGNGGLAGTGGGASAALLLRKARVSLVSVDLIAKAAGKGGNGSTGEGGGGGGGGGGNVGACGGGDGGNGAGGGGGGGGAGGVSAGAILSADSTLSRDQTTIAFVAPAPAGGGGGSPGGGGINPATGLPAASGGASGLPGKDGAAAETVALP